MHSKTFYQILKSLFEYFLTMTNNSSGSSSDDCDPSEPSRYAFKPFRYQEIKPNENSKVPYPRSGHRIGADSSNFYSFGGYNPLIGGDEIESDEIWVQSYPLFQELWRFNFAKKEWIRYPNSHTLPLELASNALVLHKNILMVNLCTLSFKVCIQRLFYRFMVEQDHLLVLDVAINYLFVV
jgi:hypothetical protein